MANKKSERTRETLYSVLHSLLEEKKLSAITVTDITERAGINRQTFYYHFSNINDLVDSYLSSQLRSLESFLNGTESPEDCFKIIISTISEHKKVLKSIIESEGKFTIKNILMERARDYILKRVMERPVCMKLNEEDRDTAMYFSIAACSDYLEQWILGNIKLSEEDLAHKLSQAVEWQFVGAIVYSEFQDLPILSL